MRQHRALGTAGGAGSVENGGQVVVGAGNGGKIRIGLRGGVGQRALAVGAERLDPGPDLRGNRADAFGLCGIAHHQRRFGVGQEIFEFVQRIGRVQRQIDRTGPHRGEVQHEPGNGFFGLCGDAVAGLDTARHQHVRHPAGAGDQVAIADALSVDGLDREPFGVVEIVEQAGKQIGVHDGVPGRVIASWRGARSRPIGREISRRSIAKTPFTKQRRRFA